MHQHCMLQLWVQLPVAAALQAVFLVGVRIVAVERVGVAHCRQAGDRERMVGSCPSAQKGQWLGGWLVGWQARPDTRRWYRRGAALRGEMLWPPPAPRPACLPSHP